MALGTLRVGFGIVLPKTSWTHTTFSCQLWQYLHPTGLLHLLQEQMPEVYKFAADITPISPAEYEITKF